MGRSRMILNTILLGLSLLAAPVAMATSADLATLMTAAEKGDVNAQYLVGASYYDGQGVAKDHTKAASWFLKAAEQGNADAQYILGHMYLKGQGVTLNYKQAASWLAKAAEQGNAEAQLKFGLMQSEGMGLPQKEPVNPIV
ncbi:tetratricopeptide repeat protein [Aeromonas sp. sif2416]|uniref:tetratricopeptide repeat protein n=1 Tax=Aeromonas sp. sif2416 TaxID=2854793 RepID=UPI001C452D96|nr:tetratricopeptide repeat protein [Aeromonas sp. sif2416]MBV7439707.1 sel1 repeat family protein [Aeromonas sp. sif2416]